MPRYPKTEIVRTASTPGPKPGTPVPVGVHANNGSHYKPETKGRKKYGPLDWSLDELIAYRQNGTPPARIPDKEMLYKLGSYGVTMMNCCDLFGISQDKFTGNLDWIENWQRGKAGLASRVRASIVEDALDKDILMAKIHLDKQLSGDNARPLVQVNVNSQLSEVRTEDLLSVVVQSNEE